MLNPKSDLDPVRLLKDGREGSVPIAGALFAVGIAFIPRGRGTGISAAQGRLEEIVAENSEQPGGNSKTT